MHHQRISPLGLLDRAAVASRQRRRSVDPDRQVAEQIRAVRIIGQARMTDGRDTEPCDGRVLPGAGTDEGVLATGTGVDEPDIGRHRLPTMTGVAGDTGLSDMRLPIAVDIAGHGQHAPRDLVLVSALVGVVLGVVAVGAVLLVVWGDPLDHRQHHARELTDREVLEHLHVLVHLRGERTAAVGCRLYRPGLVGSHHRLHDARVDVLLHPRAAVAELLRVDRRPLAASAQQAERDPRRNAVPDQVFHHGPPCSVAGSGNASKVVG